MRRRLSTQALTAWQRILQQDRKPLIDVFKPTAASGTLTSYDLPAAFDEMKSTPRFPLLETLHDIALSMPWVKADGSAGLLRAGEYAKQAEILDNASESILEMAESALENPEKNRAEIATLAMLKVMYAHFINNYCYEPCRHALEESKDPNRVGRANAIIPRSLAQPRTILCTLFENKLPIYRWQNYNEYSPANCRVLPRDAPALNQQTVTTMIRGEGSSDEIGFIGNHYVQESRTPELIAACEDLVTASKTNDAELAASAYCQAVTAIESINDINKDMPLWCSPRGYNQLRIWIPGPRNHSGHNKRDLFPSEGVLFEGSEELGFDPFDMSRGETGAMTCIIKLARIMSLFSYDSRIFGENELTSAQHDFDQRRECGQREYLQHVETELARNNMKKLVQHTPPVWHQLIRLRSQIIEHNITHYGYSRNYIYENKEASTSALFEATGGTTHQFLPTSALALISTTLSEIELLSSMSSEMTAGQKAELDMISDRLNMLQDVTKKQRAKFIQIEQKEEAN